MNDFEKKSKVILDDSLHDISPDVARRLQQARYAALEKAQPRTLWGFFPKTVTAFFAVSIISVSLFFNFNQGDTTETILATGIEMEMLSSNDNFELMEDLEFIEWLAETEEYAS